MVQKWNPVAIIWLWQESSLVRINFQEIRQKLWLANQDKFQFYSQE